MVPPFAKIDDGIPLPQKDRAGNPCPIFFLYEANRSGYALHAMPPTEGKAVNADFATLPIMPGG